MRNLVIIGNGFDLFHGIKSSYWDFKEYLEEMGEDEFIKALERYIYSDELWSSFECALGNMDYEAVEENNSCYLLGYGDEDWSDFAHHDYQMMISEELSFSENISAYIKNWILSLQTIREKKISTNIINQDNIFISFNYTDTLEQTYNIPRERILYIHGKAKESTELIVGHGDESMITSMVQKDFSTEEEEEAYIEYMEGYDVRELEAEEIIREYLYVQNWTNKIVIQIFGGYYMDEKNKIKIDIFSLIIAILAFLISVASFVYTVYKDNLDNTEQISITNAGYGYDDLMSYNCAGGHRGQGMINGINYTIIVPRPPPFWKSQFGSIQILWS